MARAMSLTYKAVSSTRSSRNMPVLLCSKLPIPQSMLTRRTGLHATFFLSSASRPRPRVVLFWAWRSVSLLPWAREFFLALGLGREIGGASQGCVFPGGAHTRRGVFLWRLPHEPARAEIARVVG